VLMYPSCTLLSGLECRASGVAVNRARPGLEFNRSEPDEGRDRWKGKAPVQQAQQKLHSVQGTDDVLRNNACRRIAMMRIRT